MARLAIFSHCHSSMVSANQLFIIATIAHKSSTQMWRPGCWSKLAKPSQSSQLFTHSPSSFPSPCQHLNDALCHWQHTILSYHSDNMCAMSSFLLTWTFTLPHKLTLAVESIAYHLMLDHTHLVSFIIILSILLVPCHQQCMDVLISHWVTSLKDLWIILCF